MPLFVNQCSDTFQPYLPAIFRELVSLLAYAAYASTYIAGIQHMIKTIIMTIKC